MAEKKVIIMLSMPIMLDVEEADEVAEGICDMVMLIISSWATILVALSCLFDGLSLSSDRYQVAEG